MLQMLPDFIVAVLIGLLVGIDRERRKTQEHATSIGGIRTFMLLALAGAATASLSQTLNSPWIFALTGLAAAAVIIAGYLVDTKHHPDARGLTTEVAGLVVFLLGGMSVVGERDLAVVLAIITSAILAYKQTLHRLVSKVGEDDLYAILKLLIASFIILPILPNKPVDPWEAVNPYKIWWLVILISGLSLIGYVATRWLGTGRGTAITGFFGGLVSSTAVSLSFSRQSRVDGESQPGMVASLACGVLLAWTVMFVRVVVEVAVVHPPLVTSVLIRMAGMGLAAGIAAGIFYWYSTQTSPQTKEGVPLRNPFSLTSAVKFALFFTAVLVVVKITQKYLPGTGLYAVAALAGLTDVDAITLSMANHAKTTGEAHLATNAITIAAMTNTAVKAGIVAALASTAMRVRIVAATLVILAVGAATVFLL